MDAVDLRAVASETFIYARAMASWAKLYPLSDGIFRSYMRAAVDSAVVLYEWSTENGRITFAPSPANGVISYTANPQPGDTLTVGTTIISFVANETSGVNVVIEPTLDGTLQNLLAFLQQYYFDGQLDLCSYAANGYDLSITYFDTSLDGNYFPIAASTAGVTLSGPFLQGAGGVLTMNAPAGALSTFIGGFFYDVRWEHDGTIVQLFGGALDLTEAVTR